MTSALDTGTRQLAVQIMAVDPTNHSAVGQTRQGQQITIDTRYLVGAVHYTPGVGEQWIVRQVAPLSWALDRKLPKNTYDLLNVADNPVPGQVQIGSSGVVSGPLTLMGSTINAQAPLNLLSQPTTALPAASSAGAGALAYDSTQQAAVVSNGSTWEPVGTGTETGPTTVTWNEITGVPTSFPTDWSRITNIPTVFPSAWNAISGLPSTFPPTLPSGTPSALNFWCGDGTWKVPEVTGGSGFQLVVGATPSGTVDGTNTVFTLPLFVLGTTMVYINGTRQHLGTAYTETNTTTLTFATAPPSGAVLAADYVAGGTGGGVYISTVGNGSATSFVLTHNLDTRNVLITVYDSSTYEEVNCDKYRTNNNQVTLGFEVAPGTNAYTAVIVAAQTASTILGVSLTVGETPSGTVNGTNDVFTTAKSFIEGSTSVFVNGLRKEIGVDYIESGIGAITFSTAPVSGDVILIDYLTSG